MSKYTVTFIKYYSYDVEADDEDKAIDIAYETSFYRDTHSHIADYTYDEVEVEPNEMS